MRHLVIFCLLLLGRTASVAQQPAEWRPNIAEDNKAALIADTDAFMVGELNSAITQAEPQQTIWGAEAPQMCSLHFYQHLNQGGGEPAYSLDATLPLGKIDPLSISVGYAGIFYVHFVGTDQGTVLTAHVASYRNDFKGMNFKKGDSATVPCNPHARYCSDEDRVYSAREIYFLDQEMAKRFARALMHAALLCGGAKAVSPF
jgi:hypothetical protein